MNRTDKGKYKDLRGDTCGTCTAKVGFFERTGYKKCGLPAVYVGVGDSHGQARCHLHRPDPSIIVAD